MKKLIRVPERSEDQAKRHFGIRNRKGFTLMELLIAIVLALIIIGAMYQVFHVAMEIETTTTARATVYSNTRAIFEGMEREVNSMFGFTEKNSQELYLTNISTTIDKNDHRKNIFMQFKTITSWTAWADKARTREKRYIYAGTYTSLAVLCSVCCPFQNS